MIGILTGSKDVDLIPALLFGGKTVRGVFNFRKDMVEEMVRFVEEHNIHPQIAKIYDWGQAKEAFEALVEQKAVGKIVVKVGEDQVGKSVMDHEGVAMEKSLLMNDE